MTHGGGEERNSFASLFCCTSQYVCRKAVLPDPRPLGSMSHVLGVDELIHLHGGGKRGERGLQERAPVGARRARELTAGRVWRVAVCSESPRLPAVEVRVGGGLSGALFKRPAEALRCRPALAAQTCRAGLGWRLLECGSGRGSRAEWLRSPRPLVLRALQPLPQPPLSASASLSLSLARSHFFLLPLPRRPHLGRLRPLVSSRSTRFLPRSPSAGPRFPEPPCPLPPARTLGSPAAGAGLAAAP